MRRRRARAERPRRRRTGRARRLAARLARTRDALRARARLLALGAALAVVAAAGVQLGPPALDAVVAHPYFALDEITVSPTRRVRPGEILARAGVRPGMSAWEVSPTVLAARIAGHPWIRRARVRRVLPRRLVVDVTERRPAAIVALDRFYYVDRRGVVFAALGDDDPLDLPLITGLADAGARQRAALRASLKMLRLLLAAGLSFRVSEVHIERERGIRVFPVEPAVALTFGWGQLRDKTRRLALVLAALDGGAAGVREVDLRFAEQAVVRRERT